MEAQMRGSMFLLSGAVGAVQISAECGPSGQREGCGPGLGAAICGELAVLCSGGRPREGLWAALDVTCDQSSQP